MGEDTVEGLKLQPLWYGPCEILEHIMAGKYRVRTPLGEELLHYDSFKPYLVSLDGTSIPFLYYRPPTTTTRADSYTVDKISRHRLRNGKLEWLVHWRGFAKPTWEPVTSFVGDVQNDWLKYCKEHKLPVNLEDIPLPASSVHSMSFSFLQ